MEKFMVTNYRGYTQVVGQIDLQTFFEQLRGYTHLSKVKDIERAIEAGDLLKAERIKRQLPFFTLMANYAECRLPHSLTRYNDLILLDFDNMPPTDIPYLRQLTQSDPNTIGCALSPRRHGLKVLVRLRTPEARALRASFKTAATATYAQLEHYHKQMYTLARQYYEALLHSKADESGSDLSRGMYATYDPDTFFDASRLTDAAPLDILLTLPSAEEDTPKKRKYTRKATTDDTVDAPQQPQPFSVDLLSQLEYRKAVEYTRRKFQFEPNSRDSFIYCLGNQCYIRHIPEETALQLTLNDYGNQPDFDPEPPLRNAYLYTNKTDAAEEEQKRPMVARVMEFLRQHYEFRRNIVLDRVEFRPQNGSPDFAPLRGKDVNSIFTHLQLSTLYCSLVMLKAIVDSNFAEEYNPFADYFNSLPPWDGTTDYIAQLAATVEAEDPLFWENSLRRWLVGLVACATTDDEQNQHMLLLYSKQGKGKSRFIRNLLPPTLHAYYRNGMINPDNKDHMLLLSTCLIINLEEFDGVSANRLADLKRIITQEKVTERKVYDTQAHTFIRRTSFAASTNNPHCLQDIGENRRMLFNSVHRIDYLRPVNHTGIYSQALALYKAGFRFWYEGDEIDRLNQRNEHFRLKDPVEESLFHYYRAATPKDYTTQWLPASAILANLSIYGRMQSNRPTLQTLVTVLDGNGFRKRNTSNGVTEYAIIEYTSDERKQNATPTTQQMEQTDIHFEEHPDQ